MLFFPSRRLRLVPTTAATRGDAASTSLPSVSFRTSLPVSRTRKGRVVAREDDPTRVSP